MKEEINSNIIIVGNFKISLSTMDRSSRQKSIGLNYTLD